MVLTAWPLALFCSLWSKTRVLSSLMESGFTLEVDGYLSSIGVLQEEVALMQLKHSCRFRKAQIPCAAGAALSTCPILSKQNLQGPCWSISIFSLGYREKVSFPGRHSVQIIHQRDFNLEKLGGTTPEYSQEEAELPTLSLLPLPTRPLSIDCFWRHKLLCNHMVGCKKTKKKKKKSSGEV